jgi:hypothetical protein
MLIGLQSFLARGRFWILALSAAALVAAASLSAAAAAGPPPPFKILRAATNANGTDFVGGVGFSVVHTGPGKYHVSFPVGTWNNGGAACFYVPLVQPVFTSAEATIVGWTTFGDGSGWVDIKVTSGVDAPLMMTFTSANC